MDCSLSLPRKEHCPACGEVDLSLWLIVDVEARADLRAAVLRGEHDNALCPNCGATISRTPEALLLIRRLTSPRVVLAVPDPNAIEDVQEVGSALLGQAAEALGESWHAELTAPVMITRDTIVGPLLETMEQLPQTVREVLADETGEAVWARALAASAEAGRGLAEVLAVFRDWSVMREELDHAARAARLLRLGPRAIDTDVAALLAEDHAALVAFGERYDVRVGADNGAEWTREADLWAWGVPDSEARAHPADWIRVHGAAGGAWSALAAHAQVSTGIHRALDRARATFERGLVAAEPQVRNLDALVTLRSRLAVTLRTIAERGYAGADAPSLGDAALEQDKLVVASLEECGSRGDVRLAMAHSNIGRSYGQRRRGDRAENMEHALVHLGRAVELVDGKDPALHARMLVNLAEGLLGRVHGERLENHARAREALEQALELFDDDDVEGRGVATLMLATVEGTRPGASRRQTLESNVARLQKIVDEVDPREHPRMWGRALLNIANSLSVSSGRPETWREAESAYERALSVVTPEDDLELWLMLHISAATHALRGRFELGDEDSATRARTHAEAALSRASPEAFPKLWATAHQNLGAALVRAKSPEQDLVEHHYRKALTILTPERHPAECLDAAREFGLFMLESDRWHAALDGYRIATSAGAALLEHAASFAGRRVEVGPLGAMHAAAAYCLLKLDRVPEAVGELDVGRTRLLALLFLAADAPVPEEVLPQPDSPPTAQPTSGRARVYLVVTGVGGAAIVVPQGRQPGRHDVVWFERLDRGAVRAFISGRVFSFDADPEQADALILRNEGTMYLEDIVKAPEDLFDRLRDRITDPVRSHLSEAGADADTILELVPSDLLGLLPVHATELAAAPVTDGATPPIVWVPAPVTSPRRARARRPRRLLALADPHGDLPWGAAEARVAADRLAPSDVLSNGAATLSALRERIGSSTHLHFACHAIFDWRDSPQSYVELAGEDRLTVALLLERGIDLSGVDLVVLSGCDTAVVDADAPEEALGLGPTLLAAGCDAVITALWPVYDAPTALLMSEFYRRLAETEGDVDEALAAACAWLRGLTRDAARTALDLVASAWPATAEGLAEELASLEELPSDGRPYDDPRHWAAFTVSHRP